jgi:hypothetical protein
VSETVEAHDPKDGLDGRAHPMKGEAARAVADQVLQREQLHNPLVVDQIAPLEINPKISGTSVDQTPGEDYELSAGSLTEVPAETHDHQVTIAAPRQEPGILRLRSVNRRPGVAPAVVVSGFSQLVTSTP